MRYDIVLAAGIIAAAFSATQARAMSCVQDSLETVAIQADAIFTAQVSEVRYLRQWSLFNGCEGHSSGNKCGSKIADVAVLKVWKGVPDAGVSVFSQDGCVCLGSYFTPGTEMLFMVVEQYGDPSDSERSDYRTGFCVRTIPLAEARKKGVVEALDSLFPASAPAQ